MESGEFSAVNFSAKQVMWALKEHDAEEHLKFTENYIYIQRQ